MTVGVGEREACFSEAAGAELTPNRKLFCSVFLFFITSSRTMAARYTSRGGRPTDFRGRHLKLEDLRAEEIQNGYLYKNIPPYPQPEFRVSKLKHDTGPGGLEGIFNDGGFRGSGDKSLMWFNLTVGPEEIRSAEEKLLEERLPEVPRQGAANNFLWRFATSPAFSETSTYGSFRFTLPLKDVLSVYRQQVCSGEEPVMKVYNTSIYKQGVQYIVLIHSPEHDKWFSDHDYPLLEDQPEDAVCKYKDGHFLWRSQAMCETHWYEMVVTENQINADRVNGWEQFYVWDQVSVALCLEPGEVLTLDRDQLGKGLTFCEMFDAPYMEYRKHNFKKFDEAKLLVEGLCPSTTLQRETSMKEHFDVADPE